jgi:DNA invertase Pin-like site-specific DNA recombinase
MRAVIYPRISNDRTGQEAGVTRQLEDCRAYAARNGDTVVAELVENDTSAYSTRPRPKYQQLVEMVKAGEVDAVYVWHPDRLYRRASDLEALVTLVESHDLVIRTVRAGDIDLTTPTGRMTARVVGSVSQHESEQKADRQARKHKQLAEQGRPSGGGRRALGYEADGVTVNEAEAAVLRQAAADIIAGVNLTEVTRRVSAAVGRPVRVVGLKGALTSYRIVGMREYLSTADRRRGATQGVVTEAVWPAILDDATWRKVRAVLLDPRRRHQRPARTYLLTGVLHCGRCGHAMSGGSGSYRCDPRNDGCSGLSVRMEPVDAIISAWVQRKVNTAPVRRKLAGGPTRPDTGAGVDVDELTDRLATFAEMLADGQMTADEWKVARDRVMQRISERQVTDADTVLANRARAAAVDVIAQWDAPETETAAKRSAIAAVLDAAKSVVIVRPVGPNQGPVFDPNRIAVTPRAEVERIRAEHADDPNDATGSYLTKLRSGRKLPG